VSSALENLPDLPNPEIHHQHRDVSGGWLRPAVFGAMDGLVTNSSLIAGVGGGGGGHGAIILTGIAGLIAGAFSMATGEYISVKSQNEVTIAEVEAERRELQRNPGRELAELAEVFMGKGLEPTLALEVARQLSDDPEQALIVHAREELGIDPDDLPSPWTAATASFGAFTVGALTPLLPYLFGAASFKASLVLAGLFAFGVAGVTGMHPGTMVLATSPGGIAEMALTARVLHLGVPVVTAFHVARMVVVVLAIGPLYRAWSRVA